MSGVAVHPTPTAADGEEVEQSHYIKKADKLDRYIYCAQCGYPVNMAKRSTGDSLGAIGNPTLKVTTFYVPSPSLAVGTLPSPIKGPETEGANTLHGGVASISETDKFGDPVDTNSGCPLCNSMNPQGIGRDSDPFAFKSIDVENF